MFDVGDEVVCINDSEPPQGAGPRVVLNQVYTVTAVNVGPRFTRVPGYVIIRPEVYVHLAEVPSPKGIGFFGFRFRKVEKKARETDITVFKEIADGIRTVPLQDESERPKPEKVE